MNGYVEIYIFLESERQCFNT